MAPRAKAQCLHGVFRTDCERSGNSLRPGRACLPYGLETITTSQDASSRYACHGLCAPVLAGIRTCVRPLQAVEAYARTEDISQIELVVREDNGPARRFYRKRGFAEVGFIPDGFREDDNRFHEILMTRSLEQPQ
ncbi:GNAT family N-acetyltransferase [Rhizobium sp. BIGb0125]|uniref:GNAT family N-acetyltransferase n=1 Tax=Rhizobium sp. BIGb0125 TaxID=2940618 RepID=UPI00386FEC68